MVELQETARQPYEDCTFSAGLVFGHPIEQVYLKLQRGGEEPTVILLRADEAQALAWVLTGAVWSSMMLEEI